jgi:hypothetical protein
VPSAASEELGVVDLDGYGATIAGSFHCNNLYYSAQGMTPRGINSEVIFRLQRELRKSWDSDLGYAGSMTRYYKSDCYIRNIHPSHPTEVIILRHT